MLAEAVLNKTTIDGGTEFYEFVNITITNNHIPVFPVSLILPSLAALSTVVVVV